MNLSDQCQRSEDENSHKNRQHAEQSRQQQNLCRQLVVILPAAYLLSLFGSVNDVWYAFPVAECVSLILSIFFFRYVGRKYIKPLDDPAAQAEYTRVVRELFKESETEEHSP